MAIDSLFSSVMNMNQYATQYTQSLLSQANAQYNGGGAPSSGSQGSANPTSQLEGLGGTMPTYPSQAASNVQAMQQQFSDAEQMRMQDIQSEVSANTDAYYASQGEGPQQRAERIQQTDAAKEALQQQQDAQMADFNQQAEKQIQAAFDPKDPNSQQKVADLEQQIQKQAATMQTQDQAALLKVGVPPQLQGMVDSKLADYQAMQQDHQNQIESSSDYQVMQQYQNDMQTYLAHIKSSMANLGSQFGV
jgi:tRNA U34 5-carboxymethylaminomethyl modifying enzyme MnmG/GidA